MLTSANQGIVINKKLSYCKDRANQGHLNQGLTVLFNLITVKNKPLSLYLVS